MRGSGRAGFTLTEVLVSLTILSVAVVGIVGMFSISLRRQVGVARIDRATELARNELEEWIASGTGAGNAAGNEGEYSWTVAASDSQEGLTLGTVEVRWTERSQEQVLRLQRLYLNMDQQE